MSNRGTVIVYHGLGDCPPAEDPYHMFTPVAKFVRTLNEVPSKFVRTLAAVRDAKQAA